MKNRLIDLSAQRTTCLQAAEAALRADNQADYDANMEKVGNLNDQIDRVKNLLNEQERRIMETEPTETEARDMAEERANTLMNSGEVKFSALEVKKAFRDATTLATGTLAKPTGTGTDIHDLIGSQVSSVVDQVYVQDLTGLSGYTEPYVITELDAKKGKVETLAGTARKASADPTFGLSVINPYEVNVTGYVDRNISRLTPVAYYNKIHAMAMKAMRRVVAGMIVNGDGESSNVMYGMKTAKNKAGTAIYATENVTAVDVNLLDTLYFAYGCEDGIGGGARLMLNKADLKAIGALRGTNEKQRLFKISPDAGNANTGTISDGGLIIPYTICPDLTALATAKQTSSAIPTMIYGDPMNYELGLFGEYTVRVDESAKAAERLLTILGDAMVGGNVIAHHGFVVATVPHT